MNKFSLWLTLVALLSVKIGAEELEPQAKLTSSSATERPTVALVLAGGGAKGAAHIGVLKALEEMRVPVDYITGTSMGAFVGGLYATGMSADEIEAFIPTVDWSSGYRDRVDRSDRRVRDKEYEDRYQLTTDLGFDWTGIKGTRGVVQGQGMLRVLRETTGNLPAFRSFNDLAIPYRSVATDIIDLEPVVIDHGHIVDAMMASMSVPGALPPFRLGDRLLVDGGVTNNMPVDVARELGADIIIAVDISSDYKQEEDFTDLFSVAEQLSNYLVRRSTNDQANNLTEQDVLITPNVGSIGTTDFSSMPEAYQEGLRVTNAHREQLQKLALSNADYQRYIDKKQAVRKTLRYGDTVVVKDILINNNTHYADQLLENRLNLKANQKLKTKDIEQAVQNLYALDRFELITYQYDGKPGEEVVTVNVNEKSWGPNYLNFRFFLEDDFSFDSQYSIGMSANFTDLNRYATELRTNFEVGTDKLMEAELYTPFLSSLTLFSTLNAEYSQQKRNAPINGFDDTTLDSTENFLSVRYDEWVFEWALGYQPTLWSELKVGLRYTNGEGLFSSLPFLGDVAFERQGLFARYRIDTLDDYSLPTQGYYIDLNYLVSDDHIKGEDSAIFTGNEVDISHEVGVVVTAAQTFERHTLVANLDFGMVESQNSSLPIDPEEIGGFLQLSGIPRNSLIGKNKVFGSLVYRYRWFDNDFGLFKSPFYIGASLEYGGVWSDPDVDINDAPLYTAGSIFAGIDSPIGPIRFAYGRTEDNFDSVYFIVGTSFK